MRKKYIVRLTEDEREMLKEIVSKGRAAACKIRRANILLNVDADGPGWSDHGTAQALRCAPSTVANVRRRFVEQGFEVALNRKKLRYRWRRPILDGEGEARPIALSRSTPPEGHSRWTLKLLADKLVELEVVESISDQTVRWGLKKRIEVPSAPVLVHPASGECGLCGAYGRYLRAVQDALRPGDTCMDEQPVQLVKETRVPVGSVREGRRDTITSTNATALRRSLCFANRWARGARLMSGIARPPLAQRELESVVRSAYQRAEPCEFGCNPNGALRRLVECPGRSNCTYYQGLFEHIRVSSSIHL